MQEFVEELRGKVQDLLSDAEKHKAALLAHFKGPEGPEKPSRRLFADTVREKIPPLLQQFFLAGYELVFDPHKDVATECALHP